MLTDRLDERADPLDGHGHVELGTGQQPARVTDARRAGRSGSARSESRRRPGGDPRRPYRETVSRDTPTVARSGYARTRDRRLPVFPLATVLFPGLVLPLHIFEERYRALVRDLVGAARGGTPRVRCGGHPLRLGGRPGPGAGHPGRRRGDPARGRAAPPSCVRSPSWTTAASTSSRWAGDGSAIAEVEPGAAALPDRRRRVAARADRPGRGGRAAGAPGDRGLPAVPGPDPGRPAGAVRAVAGGPDGAVPPGRGHRRADRGRPAAAARHRRHRRPAPRRAAAAQSRVGPAAPGAGGSGAVVGAGRPPPAPN